MSVPVSRWQVAPNAGKWVIWEVGTGRKVAVVDSADDADDLAGLRLERQRDELLEVLKEATCECPLDDCSRCMRRKAIIARIEGEPGPPEVTHG